MLRLTSLTTALLLGALPACYAETAKPEPKSPGIVVTLWPKGAMPGQAGKGTERILPARGDAVGEPSLEQDRLELGARGVDRRRVGRGPGADDADGRALGRG